MFLSIQLWYKLGVYMTKTKHNKQNKNEKNLSNWQVFLRCQSSFETVNRVCKCNLEVVIFIIIIININMTIVIIIKIIIYISIFIIFIFVRITISSIVMDFRNSYFPLISTKSLARLLSDSLLSGSSASHSHLKL